MGPGRMKRSRTELQRGNPDDSGHLLEEGMMKELTFENAYIIEFAEGIDIVGTAPMSICITISAQTIKIGGAEYEENWPKA